MPRDRLFLLQPGFDDAAHPGKSFYCPGCGAVEGLLAYYPKLRYALDVRYVEYPRPRREIIEAVGEANQGCPVLVLDDETPSPATVAVKVGEGGRRFVSGIDGIAAYFAERFGTTLPHP